MRAGHRRAALAATACACACLAAPPSHAAASGLSVSPQPGTPDASPRTQISLLGAAPAAVRSVAVRGSRSGAHTGRLLGYSDGSGASFVLDRPFAPGETATLAVSWRAGGGPHAMRYRFSVARAYPTAPLGPAPPTALTSTQSFLSRPDLHPPELSVAVNTSRAAAGDLFLAPAMAPGYSPPMLGMYGPMIVDGSGSLVWFKPLPSDLVAMDFKAQSLGGAPVLTWWQGRISPLGYGEGEDEIVQSNYDDTTTVHAGNGYRADLHELLLDPAGHAWLTVFTPVRANLSRFGGDRDGGVLDSLVQEVDVRTGLVMFEWHALGHVALDESKGHPVHRGLWDAYHLNSIDLDGEGDMLLSARNTWAAYAVATRTGRVRWRLGGRRSSFAMGRGTRFAWAHDARFASGGDISLFDDEAVPRVGPRSRALLLHVDDRRRSATLVRAYTHPTPLVAASQGNTQMLPNGDALVGWGAAPYISEFDPAGRLVYDAQLHATVDSYRAYRLPWTGHPDHPPAIFAWRLPNGAVTAFASWNGATGIASWRLLVGLTADVLVPAATVPRSGFETPVPLGNSFAQYVQVQALDGYGDVLGTSPSFKVWSWPGGSARRVP